MLNQKKSFILPNGLELKPIPGLNGYWASSDGDIYSTKYKVIRKIKPSLYRGYYGFSIWDNQKNKTKHAVTHRLIASTWIPNPNNYPIINHRDGVRTNNNIDNLEWCTQKQNIAHSINILGNARCGERNNLSKLTEEQILKIRTDPRDQRTIAREFGVSQTNIGNIKRRDSWKHVD